MLSRLH